MSTIIRTALLICATALLLAACGDSGDDTPPLATGTSSTQAGDANTGAALLVLPLHGPTVQLDQPATVRVHLHGRVTVGVHYPAHGTLGVGLTAPVPTGEGQAAHELQAGSVGLPLSYSVVIALPAGATPLQASAVLRATDVQGVPTGALGHAAARVEWTVTTEPAR